MFRLYHTFSSRYEYCCTDDLPLRSFDLVNPPLFFMWKMLVLTASRET